MEFNLCSLESALPVEITIDEDNGRYMIRKSDTSGEFFNEASELIEWIRANLKVDEFCDPTEYYEMMNQLSTYVAD
ncbi:hypothetical protein LS684_12660 [Cytobacillus spongiae]|uniref:hypothetical protein n=1 Tax=Cytobacillus spongiae TaxID=2901381 RepID=UPI001F44D358|nr:hypothetical protein [Cytobacillus spongiae]UII54523.1 hypothetical protein LS684_12660 [Cytobacillus spongiae]